ncbi:tetratricopeptide repeat protein, partial [uncultured Paraglaciecola sp.]|uniref:tetratricopeptide repeat protein n=1 Tax=uncultured Paraglaciecola sp. TaxID=1765024 RepID=UPI0025FF79F7
SIGEITKAETISSSIPQIIQKNSNIQVILGDIAQTENQLQSAQIHYLSALNSNNNYQVAVIRLYNLAKDKNVGADKFISTLRAIIDKYPTAHFQRHILADFLYFQGDILLAKQHYLILEKVAQLPRIEHIYNSLASMLTISDPKTAVTYINKALDIAQSNPMFIDTKGWILTQQGQYIEGLDLLREAFAMNSHHPSIQYHIAYNLVKSGQLEAARQQLKKVLTTKLPFAEKDLAQALMNSI